jgi:hypothetical protein
MSPDAIAHAEQLLLGATCSGVEEHGDRVLLLFGRVGLFLWCPWRVVELQQLRLGSGDERVAAKKLDELLRDDIAVALEVSGDFHDLRVRFQSGRVLEAFPAASEGDSWQVSAGANDMVVAGPTNLWSDFHD